MVLIHVFRGPHHAPSSSLSFCSPAFISSLFAQIRHAGSYQLAQLPARTAFYLIWRGSPASDLRHANALMSLWDDPDIAPIRNSFIESTVSNANKQKDKPAITRDELNQYASLLDNSFVLGYLPRPAGQPAPKPSSSPNLAPAWSGIFLVYDRTGKEAILSEPFFV